MTTVIDQFERAQQKQQTPHVRSGDTVRVHQRITEGSKVRTQAFEGVVIRTRRMNSLTAAVTLRRISSGVGVEKTFKLHAPNVERVDVLRRSKVRRNFLSFLRQRQGKAARLQEVAFDRSAAEVDETVSLVKEAEEEAPLTLAEEREQAPEEGFRDEATEAPEGDEIAETGDEKTDQAESGSIGDEKSDDAEGAGTEENTESSGSGKDEEYNESNDAEDTKEGRKTES